MTAIAFAGSNISNSPLSAYNRMLSGCARMPKALVISLHIRTVYDTMICSGEAETPYQENQESLHKTLDTIKSSLAMPMVDVLLHPKIPFRFSC